MAQLQEAGVWIPLEHTLEELFIQGFPEIGDQIDLHFKSEDPMSQEFTATLKPKGSSDPTYPVVKVNTLNVLVGV